MTEFLAALALAIVIEGLAYAAFPDQMKKMLASLLATPASSIRAIGLACAAVGLVLLWFFKG